MKRTPGPLLPGDYSRRRGGGKGKVRTSTFPPSFESWGFTPTALKGFETILRALKIDLERQKQILEEELSSLTMKEQELISKRNDLLASKG